MFLVLPMPLRSYSFFQPVHLDKIPSEPFRMDEPAPLVEDRYGVVEEADRSMIPKAPP